MNTFVVLIFFVSLAIAFFDVIWTKIRQIVFSWYLPGPIVKFPIIGHGADFLTKTTSENFKYVVQLFDKYGPTFRMWLGTHLVVGTYDVELIQILLSDSTTAKKSREYNLLSPWLNEGLLTSTGRKWLSRRKMLTPAFHFGNLEDYITCFDRNTTSLVTKLSKYVESERVELDQYLTLCALDIIFESTLGCCVNAQDTDSRGSVFAKLTKELDRSMTKRFFSFYLRSNFFWKFSQSKKEQDKLLRKVHQFTQDVIDEQREKFSASLGKDHDRYESKPKKSFLNILFEATIDGKPLSDLDIREEVDTFIFEGHDTTASALLFAAYNIAKHPNVQKQCFDEIKSVFGNDRTKPITLKDLNDLRYMDLVIKETLRLYPSVPAIGRHVLEDIKLMNGMVIPAGCNVLLSMFYLGRDARTFENANEFIPERFNSNSRKIFNFAYIPFSAGIRNCIGQKFAVLEMKAILSKVLRYYELSLSEDSVNVELKLAFELVLRPKVKLNFNVKHRNYVDASHSCS